MPNNYEYPRLLLPQVRTYGENRKCKELNCQVILCSYNPNPYCHVHYFKRLEQEAIDYANGRKSNITIRRKRLLIVYPATIRKR